jgi:hypothetical protein
MFDDGMSKQDQPVQMMKTEIQNVTIELICWLQYFYQLDNEVEGSTSFS